MRVRTGRFNVDEQARKQSRSCLFLELALLKFSFGILIFSEVPISHMGLEPNELIPMTGVPEYFSEVLGREF